MKALLLILLLQTAVTAQDIPAYKNQNLPVEDRVNDLVSRMTLEEKVAQLTSTMPMLGFSSDAATSFIDKDGKFLPEGAAKYFKNGIGQISRPGMRLGPKEMAVFTNTVQKWIIENTRLGIPVISMRRPCTALPHQRQPPFRRLLPLPPHGTLIWSIRYLQQRPLRYGQGGRNRCLHRCLT